MQIQTIEELRTLYSAPTKRVIQKEVHSIDTHIEKFLSLSPLLVIGSASAQFEMDVSPRGGDPGFVKVMDTQTLLIPDAPGNNRLDTFQNIIETAQVGLLFFLPGVDEMLRIYGRATLHTEESLLNHFAGLKHSPKVVIKVNILGAYMHCAKALMRSNLWSPEAQVDRSVLPTMGQIIKDHAQLDTPVETQEEMLKRYEIDL